MTSMQKILNLAIIFTLAAACSDDTDPPPTADGSVPDGVISPDIAGAGDSATDAAPAKGTWAVLIRGTLAGADLKASKAAHDLLAKGGESSAKAAGDTGHDVLLGTKMLGTTENQFLAIDLWNNVTGMQKHYQDPTFAAEFAKLFTAPPPQPEIFVHQPTWHEWGDMKSGDSHATYFFVVARGKLKATDPKAAQTAHDQVAAGGEATVKAAGDVAHVVFTGLTDPRQFMAVDIWNDSTNLVKIYSDPNFVAGFAALFEGAPTISVYSSTDWHQW